MSELVTYSILPQLNQLSLFKPLQQCPVVEIGILGQTFEQETSVKYYYV